MSNIVAIVGRPNVGKSTLFNRLTGERKAIIHESSGVTRDRHYGKSDWNGYQFSVIDTGGYITNSDDIFEEEIRKQVLIAIDEADVIIFLVDVTIGITDLDESVAKLLKKSSKKVFLVINKVDTNQRQYEATEFYNLGLGDYYCVSSINGSGTGELLDDIVKEFKEKEPAELFDENIPRFTIIGKPNVGKSSLANALLGEDRNIVTPISGTTRDSIHTRYNKFGHDFILVDTAGLRKKGKVKEDIEFYSTLRSIRAIEESDVCILLLDATLGVEQQDLSIFHVVEKNSKGLVVLVNKWDLVEKDTHTSEKFKKAIYERFAPFTDFPVIFTSAVNKQRVYQALEAADKVYTNCKRKISTSQLIQAMLPEIENYPPPAIKGKFIKIKFITQLPTAKPAFAFFCNLPQYVKEPYKRFLENKLREKFDFNGVPVKIFIRQK